MLGAVAMMIVLIQQKSAIWIVQSLLLVQSHNVWMLCRVVLRQLGLRYTKAYETV